MPTLADALRKRAEDLGLSGAEVARRSGLSVSRYGNYVAGVREPDLATLSRIARVLESTPNDLLAFNAGTPPTNQKSIHQIAMALRFLPEADLEAILVQVRALAAYRNARTRKGKLRKGGPR
jgi:transcriptional regulator with XRE-family HTH domain